MKLSARSQLAGTVTQIEVGVVTATYHGGARVSVRNVPSYRRAGGLAVTVDGQRVTGDVAWGGNWFYLVREGPDVGPLAVGNVGRLTAFTSAVRRAVNATPEGELVDHVELFSQALGRETVGDLQPR